MKKKIVAAGIFMALNLTADRSDADVLVVLKTSYACGLMDGATKVLVAMGETEKVGELRALAVESHCDDVRVLIPVAKP